MPNKDKIKQINSQRKPTKGFNESELLTSALKAARTIDRNYCIAMMDVKFIYSNYYLSSSVESSSCNYHSNIPIANYKLIST